MLVRADSYPRLMVAEAFEKALAINPNQNDLVMSCAITYLLTGRYKEALNRERTAKQRLEGL